MKIDSVREHLGGVRSINKETLGGRHSALLALSLSAVTEKVCHHQTRNSDRVPASSSSRPSCVTWGVAPPGGLGWTCTSHFLSEGVAEIDADLMSLQG